MSKNSKGGLSYSPMDNIIIIIIIICQDGQRLLTASNEKLIRIFDLQDENAGKMFVSWHNKFPSCLLFSHSTVLC